MTQATAQLIDREHGHYFKDVSGLDSIDVYRVLDLWKVTHPALQHAIKKLLAAGQRGDKDEAKDVQEAIDSLERWKAMKLEGQRDAEFGVNHTIDSQDEQERRNREMRAVLNAAMTWKTP